MSNVQSYVSAIGDGMSALGISAVQNEAKLSLVNPNDNFVPGDAKVVPTNDVSVPMPFMRP